MEQGEDPRAALYRRLVEAFRQGDLLTIQQALATDIVLVMEGGSPYAGIHHGISAVLAFVAQAGEWMDPSSVGGEEVIAYPDFIRVAGDLSIRGLGREDRPVRMIREVWFDRRGRVSRVRVHADDQRAFDDFLTGYAEKAGLVN